MTKEGINNQANVHTVVAHSVSVDCIRSGIGNTDQLSVKDSGKGDSDFNDSDSDVSGDGGKKSFTTFNPRLKSERTKHTYSPGCHKWNICNCNFSSLCIYLFILIYFLLFRFIQHR